MSGPAPRVRLLSDLGKGDTVCTRGTRRFALVMGFDADAVVVKFHDNDEEATLLPILLELIARAPRHDVPKFFFRDADPTKNGRIE